MVIYFSVVFINEITIVRWFVFLYIYHIKLAGSWKDRIVYRWCRMAKGLAWIVCTDFLQKNSQNTSEKTMEINSSYFTIIFIEIFVEGFVLFFSKNMTTYPLPQILHFSGGSKFSLSSKSSHSQLHHTCLLHLGISNYLSSYSVEE